MESFSQLKSQHGYLAPYFEKFISERQNYEQTQELLKKELNEYIKIGVVLHSDLIIDKLFGVTVKICDTVFDLYKLGVLQYKTENLSNSSECKFYLIEIHVSHLFQSKIINDAYWFCNVSVSNEDLRVHKTVKLKNLIPAQSLKIVVPFSDDVKSALVETIFFATAENFWPNLKINSTQLNISHHFTPMSDTKKSKTSKNNQFYQISRLYNNSVKLKPSKPYFEYTFSCLSSQRKFLEMLLKNCYHRLDVNQLQMLVSSTDIIDVNLTINNTKSYIKFDTENNTLKVSSTLDYLYYVKEYIISNVGEEKYAIDNSLLTTLQVINR